LGLYLCEMDTVTQTHNGDVVYEQSHAVTEDMLRSYKGQLKAIRLQIQALEMHARCLSQLIAALDRSLPETVDLTLADT